MSCVTRAPSREVLVCNPLFFCRLNNFWKFNRNLRRIVSSERDDLRTRLLKSGRLACVSTLDEWPRTLHERRTFTVDLTIFTVSTWNNGPTFLAA